MGVRLRIALLFALMAVLVLSIVCGGIYYFSYSARLKAIKSRLSNRAITSGRCTIWVCMIGRDFL